MDLTLYLSLFFLGVFFYCMDHAARWNAGWSGWLFGACIAVISIWLMLAIFAVRYLPKGTL